MKVEMKTIAADPDGVVHPGQVVEMDKKDAKPLLDGGYAVTPGEKPSLKAGAGSKTGGAETPPPATDED